MRIIFCLIALLLCIVCLSSCRAQESAFSLCQNGHDLVGVPLVPASCTEDGSAACFVCNRCSSLFDEVGEKTSRERLTIPASHTPDGVWKSDETEHYQVCLVCGEPTLAEKHTFVDDLCKICGILKEDTLCRHQGGSATCLEKAICESCGKPYGRLAAHNKVYVANDDLLASEATCTKKASYHASCSLCGFVYAETFTDGEFGEHDFSVESPSANTLCAPANCTSGATYYKTCAVCGKMGSKTFVFGAPNGNGHRYSLLYDTEDELFHTLVCDLCGDRVTAEHSSKTTSCISPIPCDICGFFFVPNTHVFTLKLVIDNRLASVATCQSPATYFYSCATCERPGIKTFPYGEKAEHHYENGTCIWCGKKEE